MSNTDKLAKTEKEYKSIVERIERDQERAKLLYQRILKLKDEKVLSIVKSSGLEIDELKDVIADYNSSKLIEGYDCSMAVQINSEAEGEHE